ncbi:bactofilin family protein [Methylocystis parvus]|uniref:Polymer-forming cytoskeletal protein n=1 Tax=Methylocystis parvus TaxID=134 RepID=A0A6B8M7G9_9HYPH|nr:polymer-forming cytoskeletal protein [Methylocystis parvus]QGM98448.1 polymer-forming cytoskeletal protein [Methylocystis parvus]WBK01215.1 polymer-forming cytoskeletal protein [Methylocystis parvus OBBP]
MAINTTSGFRPDQENVVYIGAGVTLKGEVSVPDLIVVDGTVEGDVTARVVCVGQTGVIRGNIAATEADISGWITDHIEIKQLLIVRSTGRVEGRVMYGEIELEKGAVVTGDLSATDDYRAVAKPTAPGKAAPQEREAPAPVAKAGNSLDRLNDAVRAAKGGQLYVASETDVQRRNVLRAPLSSRRVSA